jgi:two-component system sensor histidine kinase UhpB
VAVKPPATGWIVDLPLQHEPLESVVNRVKGELARELHDQVAQGLTEVLMQTQVFALEHEGRQGVFDQFEYIETSVREVLNNVRQLQSDLRGQPGLADEFVKAVRSDLLATYQRRTGIKVRLSVSPTWPETLPPDTSINLYRIIQEAITNAHRHGGARTVHVALKATSTDVLVVSIHDDGRGCVWVDDDRPVGAGILGMRERAALLGGELSIRGRGGGGTMVTAKVPKELLNWRRKQAPSVS